MQACKKVSNTGLQKAWQAMRQCNAEQLSNIEHVVLHYEKQLAADLYQKLSSDAHM